MVDSCPKFHHKVHISEFPATVFVLVCSLFKGVQTQTGELEKIFFSKSNWWNDRLVEEIHQVEGLGEVCVTEALRKYVEEISHHVNAGLEEAYKSS